MTWPILALRELLAAPLANGKSVPDQSGGFPVLRLTALRGGAIDLSQRKEGAWDAAEAEKYVVNEGDFLVARGNGSIDLVGRGALVTALADPVAYPDTMIRIRPDPDRIDPRFLALAWNAPRTRTQIEDMARTTAGIYKVNQTHLGSVELPVPPLDEQRRLVDLLEDHLSRLDAASRYLAAAKRRLAVIVSSVLLDLIPDENAYPEFWRRVTVAEAGAIGLGRQRHPDWHNGPTMRPYLRVANVFEDRIDTSDVMEMHWPEDTFERFKLHPGDVLLNEGQTPDLLGRPALYRGEPPETAFTNSLIRFRANKDVTPEFALLVFRRHMRAGRFKRESRITTNIAHLSAARLKPIEFPIPPVEEQERIVGVAAERLDSVKRLAAELDAARGHQSNLRRSLFAATFSGRLTGSAADVSAAEEMIGA